jgi:hypothetical protein
VKTNDWAKGKISAKATGVETALHPENMHLNSSNQQAEKIDKPFRISHVPSGNKLN